MEANDYNICVKQLSDALFRFACKSTGSPDDAHDVVQNSFEVLWQKRKDVEAGKAKAFLFQVAYRQSVDTYRRKSRISYVEAPEQSYALPDPGLKKVLDNALAQLGEQARALVLLKDYEGYSSEEIARITDLTDAQVKVYLHRARKLLKDYLVRVEHVL